MAKSNFICELCSSKSGEIIIDTIRHNYFGNYIKFDVHICKNCSLIQLYKFRDVKDTIKYYKYEYLKKTYNYISIPNSVGETTMNIENQKIRGKRIYDFLIKNKNLFKKDIINLDVLDIGCGPGGTTDAFIGKTNSIIGIEPVIESVKLGNKLGYNIKHGFLENIKRPNRSCDLIILLGTIEHSYDLYKSMNECIRVLKDHGKILIRWRSDKLWGSPIEYFNSNHYRYFSKESIRFLADKFNLKIILQSNKEIEGKPGSKYFILEKTPGYKVNQKNKRYNYKNVYNFYKKYEYTYFHMASNFVAYMRSKNYEKKYLKKYITNKKNKIRSLSPSDFHADRTLVEAREYLSYFANN